MIWSKVRRLKLKMEDRERLKKNLKKELWLSSEFGLPRLN